MRSSRRCWRKGDSEYPAKSASTFFTTLPSALLPKCFMIGPMACMGLLNWERSMFSLAQAVISSSVAILGRYASRISRYSELASFLYSRVCRSDLHNPMIRLMMSSSVISSSRLARVLFLPLSRVMGVVILVGNSLMMMRSAPLTASFLLSIAALRSLFSLASRVMPKAAFQPYCVSVLIMVSSFWSVQRKVISRMTPSSRSMGPLAT